MIKEFAYKIEPNITPSPEELVLALLEKKNISFELTEVIKKNKYLFKAIKTIQEKLNNYQLNHVLSVAEKAKIVAENLLNEEEASLLLPAAIIHDIGKTEDSKITDLINNGKKLSQQEREMTQYHVALMNNWGQKNNVPGSIIAIAARHHELKSSDLDTRAGKKELGNGYPRKNERRSQKVTYISPERRQNGDRRRPELNTQEIDRLGRILHLIDEFDALESERSYKPAFPPEKCEKILKEEGFNQEEDEKIITILKNLEK